MKRSNKQKVLPRYIAVERALYASGHVLDISFSDGTTQRVDFNPFLRASRIPHAKKYLDENQFRQFSIVGGNVVWGDFEMLFPVMELHAGHVQA